uniref:hypothetical protein n=1 Tax=Nocardia transvalensis TaxID=37333 RepID=UPI001C3F1A8B
MGDDEQDVPAADVGAVLFREREPDELHHGRARRIEPAQGRIVFRARAPRQGGVVDIARQVDAMDERV